ncbi:MAG: 7-cyano-7-deazaguanine synthase QueC [Candidatus Cloacimonadaceae bacterium]
MDTHRAIVLLSGGMDSLVTAAIAVRDNDSVCFLHINYGQRTEDKELDCFVKICEYYRPQKSLVIHMDWLGQVGGSALTDKNIAVKDYDGSKQIPQTYVPFRNANFITAAVSWAEVIKADRIYIGAVEEDSSGYPDCREVFYTNMQKTIETGTKNEFPIHLVTPVIHLKKNEIVRQGLDLKAPFEHSWSCYKDNKIACGICDSCHLRLKAFQEAGVADPIPYAEGILK